MICLGHFWWCITKSLHVWLKNYCTDLIMNDACMLLGCTSLHDLSHSFNALRSCSHFCQALSSIWKWFLICCPHAWTQNCQFLESSNFNGLMSHYIKFCWEFKSIKIFSLYIRTSWCNFPSMQTLGYSSLEFLYSHKSSVSQLLVFHNPNCNVLDTFIHPCRV